MQGNTQTIDASYDPDVLKAVSFLPQVFQPVFEFRYFNSVQSESFRDAFLSDGNMIISAPTGSGKTVLFELCILRLLTGCLTPEGNFNYIPGSLKTVYIAPLKALVQEKHRDWSNKFGRSLNLKCQELTGDTELFNIRSLQEMDIILTTPEKFDSITRRHRDYGGLSFFGDIALILIDEVHLLSDPRGAALEAVISRLKMLSRYPEMNSCPLSKIRFVAVSATIPNIDDLAEWLMVSKQGLKRFGEEVRPVKLTTKVFGYAPAKNDFLFERRLQNFLFDILMQHSKGKAAIVFCSTRKGAQEAALTLAETVSKFGSKNPFLHSYEQFERLQVAALSSNDKHMQTCIKCAVGYHNGGLGIADRNLVEGLFLNRDLQVLCTTNTLAHGVNLPAHTVVIKSTQYFSKEKGGYVEYDRGSILQMCGRAGRPQFDDNGVAIIMTRRETVHLYENLLSGCEPVESELFPSIAEHLNAEIVLMTVSDVSLAIDWLKCSFLYVRIKKNPEHYKIHHCDSTEQLEKKLKEICLQNVSQLATYGLIQTDEDGYILRPLEPGRLMAKYYLCFETMKLIVQSSGSTLEDLLHILSQAQELKWIKLRRTEKKLLNDINGDAPGRLRFHVTSPNGKIKKRIQTVEEKIFILTNDALSGEPSTLDFTMSQDVNGICSNGKRIARCMSDYFIFMKRLKESINALTLSKCLYQRLWEDSPYQLKQLVGVGMVTAKALLHAGINSFAKLSSADPRRLESLTGRKYPFGNHVKESLDSLPPTVHMKFLDESCSKQGIIYTLQLTRMCQSTQNNKKHFADLVVGTESDNKLLFHEKIRLDQFCSPYQVTIRSSSISHSGDIFAALVSEEYVGVDITAKFVSTAREKQKAIGKENNFDYMKDFERGELDMASKPASQEKMLPHSSTVSLTEQSSKCGPLKESWAVGSFSGPTFSILSDSHQSPHKEGNLDTGICGEDDLQPETGCDTRVKRAKVTKLNVFDHIRKKSRRLPGLSCISQVDTLACIDPTERSAGSTTVEKNSSQRNYSADVLNDKRESASQRHIPEGMANRVDQILCKEEPQPGSQVACFNTKIVQVPCADKIQDEIVSSASVMTPRTLSCIEPPLKKSSASTSISPPPEVFKHSSPRSVSVGVSCGREESRPFMGCTSIFSFL